MYAKSVRSTDEHGFNIVSALDEHANRAAIKRNTTPVLNIINWNVLFKWKLFNNNL